MSGKSYIGGIFWISLKTSDHSLMPLVCGQGITRRESLGQNVHTLDPCKYLVLYFQI